MSYREEPKRGYSVEVEGFAGRALVYIGAFLIATIGFVHLLQLYEVFDIAGYLGFLFLANFVGASAVAVILARVNRMWVWLLGDLIAGGAFAGFVVSRLLGLPGYPVTEASWFNLTGFTALMLEGAFLSVSLLVLTPQGRKIVALEERLIEIEQSPGPLEREIAGLRSRMSDDLADLRAHVSPRALEKQAIRGVRRRLPEFSKRGWTRKPASRSPVSRATEAAKSHPLAILTLLASLLLLGWKLRR